MSQRKALIASLVITLVLALTAVGIRAAFFETSEGSASPGSAITVAQPGEGDFDEEDRSEGSVGDHDDEDFGDEDSDDDRDEGEDHEDEEDDDDD